MQPLSTATDATALGRVVEFLADPNDASATRAFRTTCRAVQRAFDAAVVDGRVTLAYHCAFPRHGFASHGWHPASFAELTIKAHDASGLKKRRLAAHLAPNCLAPEAGAGPRQPWHPWKLVVCVAASPTRSAANVSTAKAAPIHLDIRVASPTDDADVHSVVASSFASHLLSAHSVTVPVEVRDRLFITAVGDDFFTGLRPLSRLDLDWLWGARTLGSHFLHGADLREVNLAPLRNVASAGAWFLAACNALQVVDLGGLRSLVQLPDNCLRGCVSLVQVRTAGMEACLRRIGDGCFKDCPSLTALDMAGFANVTSIGPYFASECPKLLALDFAPLTQLTTIGTHLAQKCQKLQRAPGLRAMGPFAFAGCHALRHFDTAGLNHVTAVESFLAHCGSLTTLDLCGLANVTDVGDGFLRGCSQLGPLDLRPLRSVRKIGDGFAAFCTSLRELDTIGLESVETCGAHFLRGNTGLRAVDLRGLVSATALGSAFMEGNTALETLGSLHKMSALEALPDWFLANCRGLSRFAVGGSMPRLRAIGANVLRDCSDLEHLDTRGFEAVQTVGASFARGCVSLRSIDPSGFAGVTVIAKAFLSRCEALAAFDAAPLGRVTSFDDDFLSWCTSLTRCDLSGMDRVVQVGPGLLDHCPGLPNAGDIRSALRTAAAARAANPR